MVTKDRNDGAFQSEGTLIARDYMDDQGWYVAVIYADAVVLVEDSVISYYKSADRPITRGSVRIRGDLLTIGTADAAVGMGSLTYRLTDLGAGWHKAELQETERAP